MKIARVTMTGADYSVTPSIDAGRAAKCRSAKTRKTTRGHHAFESELIEPADS
jgi:hypothetical protein